MADEQKNNGFQLNLTIIALVSLVAIVSLVALVMNAASAKTFATGSQQVSATGTSDAQNVAGNARFGAPLPPTKLPRGCDDFVTMSLSDTKYFTSPNGWSYSISGGNVGSYIEGYYAGIYVNDVVGPKTKLVELLQGIGKTFGKGSKSVTITLTDVSMIPVENPVLYLCLNY